MDLLKNVPLAPLTTLKVGGPARLFARVEQEGDVANAFDYAARNDLPVFVLGGGSNILVSDRGFEGIVIQIAHKGIDVGDDIVTAQAGEDWDAFVGFCVDRDLAGIECLSGIPGFVGGTPVQNVGAYGQEVSETIVKVRCFDRDHADIVELDNAACEFTYRKSIFNSTHRDRYVVLAVEYKLRKNGEPKISYKDLTERFRNRTPSLSETRETVLKIRRAKSMVIDPDDPNSQSAGSFFKNPIVEQEVFDKLARSTEAHTVPHFPADEGKVKIPAAWLIEQSGFQKGHRLGNAGISTNHSLAIVNCGHASAAEIIALKEQIQNGVEKKFDILLQPEPIFVGFD